MTNQEAISAIETAKGECEWNAPLDYQIAFDIAIRALRKQIPQRPILIHSDGEEEYLCPVCKKPFGYCHAYCAYCGQSLDWSEFVKKWEENETE